MSSQIFYDANYTKSFYKYWHLDELKASWGDNIGKHFRRKCTEQSYRSDTTWHILSGYYGLTLGNKITTLKITRQLGHCLSEENHTVAMDKQGKKSHKES